MTDIVNENGIRTMNILEANYSGSVAIKDLLQHMGNFFHYPLVVEYVLATRDSKTIAETLKPAGATVVDWDVSKSKLPTLDTVADLLIYRETPETAKAIDMATFSTDMATNVKENGFVLAMFRSKLTKAERYVHSLTGDGPVNDETLGKRIVDFTANAQKAGFLVITQKSDSIASTSVLLRKTTKAIEASKQVVVEVEYGNFEGWVEKLKSTFSQYKNRPKNENIWLLADDNNLNGVIGLVNCLRQEPGGERFRCISSDSRLPRPVDFTKAPYSDILAKDMVMNVFQAGQVGSYRLLNMERNYELIETNEAFVDVDRKGDLSSLKWFDRSTTTDLLKPNQTNVKIFYAGVDYKDYLLAMGKIWRL